MSELLEQVSLRICKSESTGMYRDVDKCTNIYNLQNLACFSQRLYTCSGAYAKLTTNMLMLEAEMITICLRANIMTRFLRYNETLKFKSLYSNRKSATAWREFKQMLNVSEGENNIKHCNI